MTTSPTGELMVDTDDPAALRLGVALGARKPHGRGRLYMTPKVARRWQALHAAGFSASYSGGTWKPERGGVRYSWAWARQRSRTP